ncbi:PREDICTED: achaete-scute homolog 5 [Galeopterus variegatus]|uniref:Achaete-scute homolog 5 n=1 Tax=Galeopterus variegatus TaxID=482537 RepID=A0ABM0RF86_GALVR|nr:PREDICTED: achaete-scute homolog 5 [Galeopterus variegatus]
MNSNFCRALVDCRPVGPPSCVQLGVVAPPRQAPLSPAEPLGNVPFLLYPGHAESPYYDPYAGVLPYVPLPGAFGVYDYPFEPAFIQKRNERERQRVKCVNEGYARLRGHLPGALAEKRLSKVETLRATIRYIKYLQELLAWGRGSERRDRDRRSREGAAAGTTEDVLPGPGSRSASASAWGESEASLALWFALSSDAAGAALPLRVPGDEPDFGSDAPPPGCPQDGLKY